MTAKERDELRDEQRNELLLIIANHLAMIATALELQTIAATGKDVEDRAIETGRILEDG